MDDSTDSVTPQPTTDNSFLSALTSLATTGANAYTTLEGEKIKEATAAQQTAAQNSLLNAQANANANSITKQKWFMPTVIVAGLLILLIVFKRR
jgi:hypothetical protein